MDGDKGGCRGGSGVTAGSKANHSGNGALFLLSSDIPCVLLFLLLLIFLFLFIFFPDVSFIFSFFFNSMLPLSTA